MIVGNPTTIIRIADSRPDFDKACNEAYSDALRVFGITEDGYAVGAFDFIRQSDCLCVKFLSYTHTGSMVGHEHVYKFEAWIERNEDE